MKRVKGLLSIALTGSMVLASWGVAAEEDRSAVLERIKPVGTVIGKEQAAPVAEKKAEALAVAKNKAEAAPAPAAKPAAAVATGPEALAQAKGCLVCHKVDMKVVGPAYKDVAAKYKGDAGAFEMLVAKAKSGGTGTWGQIPMPPQAHVPEEDLRTIIKWVLSL